MVKMYEQVPRIRRERLMDMAEAASVPGWVQRDRQRWWDRQVRAETESRAPARVASVDPDVAAKPYVLTFNGIRIGLPSLLPKMTEFARAESDATLGRWIGT
jgi:hypothetical protein